MLREWLINYCEDVFNGEIIACEKHKQACQRFMNDLKREGTDDFPYIFDEEKAMKFIQWMTLFKHTKGKLAGNPIQPHSIQIFVFANVYGWLHKDSGLRRFKKAYWQVGRKNAKSQSLSCVASYEAMALGENQSEVYIGATKTEQSKIVWNEAKSQIMGCDFLKGKYKVAYGKIEHSKSGSIIAALSKDAGKTGDGLNVQCGIIDEYHAHPTSEIYDVLVSGMGARPQPLIMVITTAGFELNHPAYSVEYPYVSQIVDPHSPIENEEYFVMVNELDPNDDIKDETNFEKANPILCSYEEGRAYLRGELKSALDVPEKMRNFLTKNCNIWINQREHGYMNMEKWSNCKENIKLEDFKNCECDIGIDLSAKSDLTSIGIEFKKDNKYYIFSHSFMPEDTVEAKRKVDKVPYDLWVQKGFITATPGAVVDYAFIKSYIQNLINQYNFKVRHIAYDSWNASMFAQEMEAEGFVMVEIIQGMKTLAPATSHFREEVYQGNVIHENNPVLNWAVGNAVTRSDHNLNFMLDKSKARERIDPIASVINAHVMSMKIKTEIDLNAHILSGKFSF